MPAVLIISHGTGAPSVLSGFNLLTALSLNEYISTDLMVLQTVTSNLVVISKHNTHGGLHNQQLEPPTPDHFSALLYTFTQPG